MVPYLVQEFDGKSEGRWDGPVVGRLDVGSFEGESSKKKCTGNV